jgi:hypothetical protein
MDVRPISYKAVGNRDDKMTSLNTSVFRKKFFNSVSKYQSTASMWSRLLESEVVDVERE